MFRIRNKIGNFFALCVGIAFCLLVYGEHRANAPEGYYFEQRQDVKELFAQNMDLNAIPRLTINDLE
jgi:hypothetical protein